MKSCKFKTSKISRLSRENGTKSPGIRDGNFPKKSREIPSGNPGRETLVTISPFKYDFFFIFEKRGIPLFIRWYFNALLSRNNAKFCKIARIIIKIHIFSRFFTVNSQSMEYYITGEESSQKLNS